MNLLRRAALLTGASLAVLSLAASPLALAHDGVDDESTNTSSDHSAPDSDSSTRNRKDDQSDSDTNRLFTATDATANTTTNESKNDGNLRNRAKQLLEDRRANRKERSQEQRQKACQNHQAAINKRLNNLGNGAQRHLDAFDKLFSKVKAYQDKNKLDVSNYDELVADTTAKQATASAAVAALKGNAGSIDCAAADPASVLAVDKTAADDARTALQAYRSSLKALISALIAAKPVSTDSTGDN